MYEKQSKKEPWNFVTKNKHPKTQNLKREERKNKTNIDFFAPDSIFAATKQSFHLKKL